MKKLLLLTTEILVFLTIIVKMKQRGIDKMSEWVVKIIGNESDLVKLAKFYKSPKLYLTRDTHKGGNTFILKSTDFKTLKENEEVKKKAEKLIARVNASARMSIGLQKTLKAGMVNRVHSNGKREAFITGSGGMRMGGSAPAEASRPNGTFIKINPPEPNLNWSTIAEHDRNVDKVMDFLNADTLNWNKLSCIYEIIEEDMGGIKKIQQNKWATEDKIKKFTQTANSHGAIGIEARHSRDKFKPPKNPMTLSEAKTFIINIARNWLNSKLE